MAKKSKKKVKVADLPKQDKKKAKRVKFIHNPRLMGLFFIAVIGLLSGLLLFNLIVHFGFVDTYEDFSLTSAERSAANGKKQQSETFEPTSQYSVIFEYPSNRFLAQRVDEAAEASDNDALFVLENLPVFDSDADAYTNTSIASLQKSSDSKDEVVTDLSESKASVKEIDFAGTKATEIVNPNGATKILVFEDTTGVYILRLSTNEKYATDTELIRSTLKLKTK